MSTPNDQAAAYAAARQAVELQRNFLRNALPAGDGICLTCRSTADPRFEYCYQCSQHRSASGGQLADVVVPISYSIRGGQHAHNLIVYKAAPPSLPAQYNLSALGILYLAQHWACLSKALGGAPTCVVTVPSTRGRAGVHPLETLVAARLGLPMLWPAVNQAYSAEDRSFHADRFLLPLGAAAGARVLLLDDTWTTGGRIQSLAHALKTAGAVGVAVTVLGRHVNPDFGPSGPLIESLRAAPAFDLERCALDDL